MKIRSIAAPFLGLSLLACAADVSDLTRSPAPGGGAVQGDAGGAVADPAGCQLGWVDVVRADGERASVAGISLAAQPSGFALTWSVHPTFSAPATTWIAFFDATGTRRGEPIEVGEGSRVIAYEGGFLRGGADDLERYDAEGRSLEKGGRSLSPLAFTGGRLWGLNRDGYIATTSPGPLEALSAFAVGVRGTYRAIGFDAERFVVGADPRFGEPADLSLYGLEVRGALVMESVALPGESLAAAAWNEAEQRFELLAGARIPGTRDFAARLARYDERGLTEGPLLHPGQESVAYEGLAGAIAAGANGTLAIGYRSPYNASEMILELVRGDQVERVELDSGRAYRTPVLLESFGDRFAVVYGAGAASTAVHDTTLQLRCDVPQ